MAGQELVATSTAELDVIGGADLSEFVTFNIAGQLFGIPVLIVQDILVPENIASVPLAPPEVRGSINLRGRIVTVVDVRVRLGLERREVHAAIPHADHNADDKGADDKGDEGASHDAVEAVKRKMRQHMMGVTVEHQNELYTLLVDSVGDVISINKQSYEGNPSTLDPLWREFASGVYRLEGSLMVVLDVERLLEFKSRIF
jgi:purine-binding chemotaxis protein CheW